jgi:hypothetical protein
MRQFVFKMTETIYGHLIFGGSCYGIRYSRFRIRIDLLRGMGDLFYHNEAWNFRKFMGQVAKYK